MRKRGLFSLVLFVAVILAGCTSLPEGIQPVRGFAVQNYLGSWYEIARLDHRFERGLSDVSATYSMRDDGGIKVINRGYDSKASTWREAVGKAYFIGEPDVASLKVSFFGPFYGGYHIFALDPGYRWALVSGPSHNYFWILARDPAIPRPQLEKLLTLARESGFNTDALIYPTHQVSRPIGDR